MKAQASHKPVRRDSPARDTLRALAMALGVHLLGIALLGGTFFLGGRFLGAHPRTIETEL